MTSPLKTKIRTPNLRVIRERRCAAFAYNGSAFDHIAAISDLQGKRHVLLNEQHRDTLGAYFEQNVAQ